MAVGLLKLGAVLVLFYVAVALTAFVFQRKLEYLPDPASPPLPPGAAYADLREVELTADDGVRLEAWYWPGERPLTIVVFHGNAGNRGHRLWWMAELRKTGAGVFLLDYRGYGGSDGAPTEEGFYRDGEATMEWVRANTEGDVVILGQSLGTGVAVEMALRHEPAALVLQAASLSAAATARNAYPFLPVHLLMWDQYDCAERIRRVRCPIFAIHGERDAIIPVALGRALFDAAPEPKTWWAVAGAGHNDLIDRAGNEYLQRLTAFLEHHGALR
jgi:fermentation-respiration switch protein FrsA (DUF1100 family)